MRKLGQVTFSSDAIDSVTVWHDADAAVPTDGYGGWKVVDRDRRKGLTQWDGIQPKRLPIAILFDGLSTFDSQEIAISRLSRMALPPGEWEEPPVVQVDGDVVPQIGPTDWVIENLEWGKNVMWDFSRTGVMSRLRADCVVHLLEFVDEDRVAFAALPPASGVVISASSGGWPKQYITKMGDTLMKIAAIYYHDSTKYGQIAAANNIRDPKHIPKGTLLTIPKP